jgi:hypothetical protein
MSEVEVDQLKGAVEQMHGRSAWFAQSLSISEKIKSKTVWEGVVHMLGLTGNAAATRAYVWSPPAEESTTRRFFAVLHQPPIDSPQAVVRAAIVAEQGQR